MMRSALTSQRRQALADAAAGQYPAPVSVVLYLRASGDDAAKSLLPRLIAHAKARNWVIVGSVLEVPAPGRPDFSGWPTVQDLVSSGQCSGVVAFLDSTARPPASVDWRSAAHTWLQEHGAFVAWLDTGAGPR